MAAGEELTGMPVPNGQTRDRSLWGGRGDRIEDQYYVPGTSGADVDVARYEDMAQRTYANASAPIDRTQSMQSRGHQGNALGMMQNAAWGGAPSRAEIYGQKMTDDSIDAAMATAASARGGPLSQAAAMQQAQYGAAQQRAAGARDLSALRAQEMAQARGDYFGASSGMRGQDMAGEQYATDNEYRQRALNTQDRQFYEQRAWDTRKQEQDSAVQKEQIGNAAWYQGRKATMEDEQNSWDKMKDVASGVGSFVGGLFSDVRAKEDIQPISGSRSQSAYGPVSADARQTYTPSSGGIIRENPYGDASLPVRSNPYASTPAPIASSFGDVGGDMRAAGKPAPSGPSFGVRALGGVTRGLSAFGKPVQHRAMGGPIDAGEPYLVGEEGPELVVPRSSGDVLPASVTSRFRMNESPGGGSPISGPAQASFDKLEPGGGMNVMGSLKAHSDFGTRFQKNPGASPFMSDERSKYIVSDTRAKEAAYNAGKRDVIAEATKDVGRGKAPPKPGDPNYEMFQAAVASQRAQQARGRAAVAQEGANDVRPRETYVMPGEKTPGGFDYPAAPGRQMQSFARDSAPASQEVYAVPDVHASVSDERAKSKLSPDQVAMRDGSSDERTYNFDKSFHRDSPADQKRVKRGVEDRASKDADDMMAGYGASLAKGPSTEEALVRANLAQEGSAYVYKPEFTPPEQVPGEQNVGPMAQTMASDPVAATAVKQDGNGTLMLDQAKLSKLHSTGIASLQKQILDLERRYGRGRR